MEAKYQHFLTLIEAGEAAALKEALEKATFEAGEELKLLSHADHNGRTLLHSAASGEGESLEALLNAFGAIDGLKSAVDAPDESGETALMVAAEYGDKTAAAALIGAGADAYATTAEGATALQRASEGGHGDIVAMLGGATDSPSRARRDSRASVARRDGVSSESVDPNAAVDVSELDIVRKDAEAEARIRACIGSSVLFDSLDAKTMEAVIGCMKEVTVAKGSTIIKQGDGGDDFYVVEKGSFDCFLQKDKSLVGKELGVKVFEYSAGMGFGELALMYNTPRAATIVATSDSTLWAITRNSFRRLVMAPIIARRNRSEELLKEVPLLKSIDKNTFANIADALEPCSFAEGETILRQGDMGNCMFILSSGSANAHFVDDEHPSAVLVKEYRAGDHFGELAVLRATPRAATITAATPCECFKLDRDAYLRLAGTELGTNMEKGAAEYQPLDSFRNKSK